MLKYYYTADDAYGDQVITVRLDDVRKELEKRCYHKCLLFLKEECSHSLREDVIKKLYDMTRELNLDFGEIEWEEQPCAGSGILLVTVDNRFVSM